MRWRGRWRGGEGSFEIVGGGIGGGGAGRRGLGFGGKEKGGGWGRWDGEC